MAPIVSAAEKFENHPSLQNTTQPIRVGVHTSKTLKKARLTEG